MLLGSIWESTTSPYIDSNHFYESQQLVQISVFFMKSKFTPLKPFYFHFETPIKQMLVLFSNKNKEKLNLAKIYSNMRVRH